MAISLCSAAVAVVLHLGSIHTEPGFDDKNIGVGLQCRLNQSWSVETGIYRNSYSKNSVYLAGEYRYTFANEWAVGAVLGIANNYVPVNVIPIGGVSVHTPKWHGWGGSLLAGPKLHSDGAAVVHFMLTKDL